MSTISNYSIISPSPSSPPEVRPLCLIELPGPASIVWFQPHATVFLFATRISDSRGWCCCFWDVGCTIYRFRPDLSFFTFCIPIVPLSSFFASTHQCNLHPHPFSSEVLSIPYLCLSIYPWVCLLFLTILLLFDLLALQRQILDLIWLSCKYFSIFLVLLNFEAFSVWSEELLIAFPELLIWLK